MDRFSWRGAVIITLILVAAFSRIIPHPPNFSPLNTIALFGAAYFPRPFVAIAVPLAATWLSDLFLNNVTYAQANQPFVWGYPGMLWQYAAYVLIAAWGLWLFRRGTGFWHIATASLSAGLIFFVVSNFGVWASGGLYPQTISGLIACYVAALPFYQGTLLGDIFYAVLLFGGFHLAQKKIPQLQEKTRAST
ncbi:MAG: hypothetical protein NZL89_02935 [Leptospiraceae bacterium]|nr:hypothetical protein [Leptospiraceae bacterium]